MMITHNSFMAFYHIVNYVNGYGYKSALAARVDWSHMDSKYATPMEQSAGAGFLFIGKPIRDNRFNFAFQMVLYGIYRLTWEKWKKSNIDRWFDSCFGREIAKWNQRAVGCCVRWLFSFNSDCQKLVQRVSTSCTSVFDEPRPGVPKTATTEDNVKKSTISYWQTADWRCAR